MKKYTNPEMELYFVIVDVITTSGAVDPADDLGSDNDFGALPAVD